MTPHTRTALTLVLISLLTACTNPNRGTLLLIGGALARDNTAVYTRLLEQTRTAPADLVIATAASRDEDRAFERAVEAIRGYEPNAQFTRISRDTRADDAVEIIDRAHTIYFTGGDQKRITTTYRPDDTDGPELLAIRRLLQRGGLVAGTSAGAAMMGNPMFLGGRSIDALANPLDRDDPSTAGPRIAPGMALLADTITDSHFFRRNRIGRLVAALEQSGTPLGLGVGENAAVDINLADGIATAVGPGASLLVDARELQRSGDDRRNLHGQLLADDRSIDLDRLRARTPPNAPVLAEPEELITDDPRASRVIFEQAASEPADTWQLTLDGWRIVARGDGENGAFFDIIVDPIGAAAP